MITTPHVVAAIIAAAVYVVVCVVKPHRKCSRCKDTPGRSKRFAGVAGPEVKCKRCGGRREHPRRFAGAVHWFIWAAIVDPLRERRDKRDSGQSFSYEPPTYSRAARGLDAGRLRAARRAERLLAFQARLQARTAPRAWQFA